MERSSLCSKLKHESISSNTNRGMKQMYDYKFKASSWDFGNEHNNIGNWKESDLVAAGFSWPPRSYTCSFCKREFRSAQALGGHMNVHRRDRARLRLSPSTRDNSNNNDHNIILGGGNKNAAGGQLSTVNLNLDPNPSLTPNPNLSSLFTKFPQFTSTLPPICPLPANALSETRRFGEEDVSVRNSGPIASDLIKMKGPKVLLGVEKFDSGVEKGRGVLKKGDPFVRLDLEIGLFSQSKEELDLELRLGYA